MALTLSSNIFDFLSDLRQHNNREWFAAHKDRYKSAHEEIKGFFHEVQSAMTESDEVAPAKLMRIYRDVRFRKDKTPYNPRFAGSMQRLGAERRGGYYLHLEPGASMIACGFWGPEKEDLLRIRKEFELQPEVLLEAIHDKTLTDYFGALQGDGLKTAPRGFDKHHPQIEYIRMKQYYFSKALSDTQVTSEAFMDDVIAGYSAIRPFFDAMSEVLTTDLNGVSTL